MLHLGLVSVLVDFLEKTIETQNKLIYDYRRYIHPKDALREVFKATDEAGPRVILRSPHHTKEKERFIASAFCFILRKFKKRECFLKQPLYDPPDFEIEIPTERDIADKPFDNIKIELVTIPEILDKYSDKDIVKEAKTIVLKTKLDKIQRIDKLTILLIWLNCKKNKSAFRGVMEAIHSSKRNPYVEIWDIRQIEWEPNNELTFASNCLFPVRSRDIKIGLIEELRKGIEYPHKLIDKYKSLE